MPEEGKLIPVKVSLRCRPLITKELSDGCQECLEFVKDEPQVLIGKNKAFTYDFVFRPSDTQESVYEMSVKPLVSHIFKGYNATVLAYGQTGSGKTFTMGGGYQDSLNGDEVLMGVIPRVVRDIFDGIDTKTDHQFEVRVSYLEIYKEDLIDLLTAPTKRESIMIREDNTGGIKLQGMQEVEVGTYNDTMHLLEKGSRNRTTGATAMNNTSSRSHAIFTIHIDQRKTDDENTLCHVKFHLVDLAGSERAKRTKAEGDRFKEGVNINKGLLALGNVISALGEDVEKRSHVPYRDSKLTRILQDSLGGNSHTVMVACVSPADSNMEETLNTLRYADRARKIKNKPLVNCDPKAAEIMRLKQMVQQLRLQLVGGSGVMSLPALPAAGDSADTAKPPAAGTNHIQAKEIKTLREKNKVLTDENKELRDGNGKLSQELQNAVDQITRMCERVITLESSLDTLRAKTKELQEQTGLDLEVLSTSLSAENNPVVKEQIDKIKQKLTDNIKSVETEEILEDAELMKDKTDKEQDFEPSDIPYTPQSNAISQQYALKQAMRGRELQELNRLLEKKQELANQMSQNDSHMENMRQQYEATTKSLEEEITTLQKEREDLQNLLKTSQTNNAAQKVSEQRRKRLQELEQQMTGLKKKLNEQGKIVKMKNQTDKQVSKLNIDIQSLKQQRVKLMKQMKEDADQFRKWKQEKDKEVLQLMQKDRKRQCEIAKLQRVNERQQTVLKRKAEEAAAANKRLKDAMAKHKEVMNERSKKQEKYDSSGIGNRVRQWLNQELEVRVSVREAKYHLDRLLKDRKTLNGELQHLERTLNEGPTKKRMAWTGKGESFERSLEVEDIEKQIKSLKQEIELRNAQITDIQEKILDAEQDRKEKDTYSNIHTMVEAKCAMKFLLEEAVGAKADISMAKGELNEVKENYQDVTSITAKYQGEVRQVKQDYEQQMTEMQQRYEDKILFLLRQPKSESEQAANRSLDEATRKRLEFQQNEIERMSELSEKLEKKSEECQRLQRQLATAAYHDRRVSYLPSITSPGGSPLTLSQRSPALKEKRPRTVVGPDPEEVRDWLSEEDEEEEDSDEERDPNWRLTPYVKKFKRVIQRESSEDSSSDTKCGCKGTCSSKRCTCRRLNGLCGRECKCSQLACENREKRDSPERDNENDSQTTMNSTFCMSDKDSTINNNSIGASKGNKKRNVLGALQDDEVLNSSEEFVNTTKTDESIDTMLGGIKKKRKLLNTHSSSFFSPLFD